MIRKRRCNGFATIATTMTKEHCHPARWLRHALHLEVARANVRARMLYSSAQFETREKFVLMSLTL